MGVLHNGDAALQWYESKNGNVILTAAHCISGSRKGTIFPPEYHDGEEAYASYPVAAAYVRTNWNKNHNIDYDFPYLTLGEGNSGGKAVNAQSIVGGNAFVTSDGYKNSVEFVGYNDNEQKSVQCRVSTYEGELGQLGCTRGPFCILLIVGIKICLRRGPAGYLPLL